MGTPDYSGAVDYALGRLEKELSPTFTYHNLWHTEEGVIPASVRIAQLIGVSRVELHLLEVAAAFHDLGFVDDYTNHEVIAARIAAQILPELGFSSRHIERIMGMILATRLPQSPRNLLEEIIADADLDVLGRPDFFKRNEHLRQEWTNLGQKTTAKAWVEGQLAFIRNHSYFTPAARMLRDDLKKQHIAMLEERLRSLSA